MGGASEEKKIENAQIRWKFVENIVLNFGTVFFNHGHHRWPKHIFQIEYVTLWSENNDHRFQKCKLFMFLHTSNHHLISLLYLTTYNDPNRTSTIRYLFGTFETLKTIIFASQKTFEHLYSHKIGHNNLNTLSRDFILKHHWDIVWDYNVYRYR